MIIAEVVGNVTSPVQMNFLDGRTLLLVQPLTPQGAPSGNARIAIDTVGAGTGDLVLYATGSSARQTELTQDKPCDAVAMAVVDSWDLGGENVYEKWA